MSSPSRPEPSLDLFQSAAQVIDPGGRKNPYCTHDPEHHWCPLPGPQMRFTQAPDKEVLYGGAAGGGKTITMLHDALRYIEFSTYRAIFFRRTFPELRQVLDIALDSYSLYGATYTERDHAFTFPSGAKIYLAYLEKDKDKLRYQGMAFHRIYWDELTQWATDSAYMYLWTRNRPFKPDPTGFQIPCVVRAASNPGGPGHGWVKKRFIDQAEPNDSRVIRSRNGRYYTRLYIPATLDDNPILRDANGGDYETSIMAHPDPEIRRALRYGDWNITVGAVFNELRSDVHLTKPTPPERNTRKVVAADWAYAGEAVALWIETDSGVYDTARSRVYREWITTSTPPAIWAAGIVKRSLREESDGSSWSEIEEVILDSAAWNRGQDGSPSPAEQMMPVFQQHGIALRPAEKGPDSIVHGVQLLHTYFWTPMGRKDIPPLLTVSESCPLLWEQLTTIQRGDPERGQDPEKPANDQKDDRLDALRYWAQSRPRPAPPTELDYELIDFDYQRFKDDSRNLQVAREERVKEARVPVVWVRDADKAFRDTLKKKVKRKHKPWERVSS